MGNSESVLLFLISFAGTQPQTNDDLVGKMGIQAAHDPSSSQHAPANYKNTAPELLILEHYLERQVSYFFRQLYP